MDNKEETKIVKKALMDAGYRGIKVGHGKGTAYGWLELRAEIDHVEGCRCKLNEWGIRVLDDCCKERYRETWVGMEKIAVAASAGIIQSMRVMGLNR